MDAAEQLQATSERVKKFLAQLKATDLKPNVAMFPIDGITYSSTKLPARVGLELMPRVSALLGAGLLRLVVTQELDDLGPDKIMQALVMISDRAMRDGLVPLVLDLLKNTVASQLRGDMSGGPVVPAFDSHFAGEYGHLLAVCTFVLAHNFRGPTLGGH